ncbi:MAG TPA: 50S ribosomal protein L4, partial [Candidatus Polarisedimenticolaceae bacterium]|nr:50S ribosomal protein L4 [Candidatus Polarisedimenticolaceae bacterium]
KLLIIEDFVAAEGKVSSTMKFLTKLDVEGSVLLVVAVKDALTDRATRNMPGIAVVSATYLNVFTILNADVIIMTQAALEQVEKWLGAAEDKPAKKPSAKKSEVKS